MSEYRSEEQFSEDLMKIIAFSERVPYASKAANNFRWAKLRVDSLDIQYPDTFDEEYILRVQDNYRLLNGLSMKNYTRGAYQASVADIMALQSEGLDIPNTELEHFDFYSSLIEGLWGDQKSKKLRFTITDSSIFTQNYIKEYGAQSLKTHFDTKLIKPMRNFALLQWQIKEGVNDIFSLNDAERKQMLSDVNASMESLIPVEISNFMKFGAMGNIEKQGQALAEALVHHLDFKYKIDQAYLHSFATDGAIFESGVRRNKVYTEWVDLTEFNTGGSYDSFVNKNPWFKRIKNMHPSKIWTEWGGKFTREDIRNFEAMVSVNPSKGESTARDERFVANIDFEGKVLLSETNLLTEEGQQKYTALMQKIHGSDISNYDDIRVSSVVWSSLCKMKKITRGDRDRGIVEEYFDEFYEFNPENGDLEEDIEWVPQYWGGKKIGKGEKPIFVDVGPIPFSRRDITDPYECVSPYTGGFMNDLNGRGYRRSPLDRAKPLIHAVNFQMKTIRDREATDIGKVVLMTVAAKPKGWSWGKLIEVVRATKMLPINTQASGLTAADVQFFKEIDLSNIYEILPRINYLQFLLNEIGKILALNQARQGSQPASTPVGNNMANLNRSFSQTRGRSAWLDKIAEDTIQNLIYLGTQTAKNGNIFMRYVLSDLSIANIDIDIEEIDSAYYGVKVSTDDLDIEKLNIGRDLLIPFIQGKELSYQLAMETLYASTRGELLNIASRAQLEAQINAAKSMDFARMSEEEKAQKALETESALLELKSNLKMQEDAPNIEAKKEMAAMQSMTIAHGNDINDNNENDYLESAREDREFKREELLIKDTLERDKLALEDHWNAENIKALNKKTMALAAKKPAKAKK